MTPWLMLPSAGGSGNVSLHIGLRSLLPSDFQLLTTDANKYNYVDNLANLPAEMPTTTGGMNVALPAGSLLEALTRHAAAH